MRVHSAYSAALKMSDLETEVGTEEEYDSEVDETYADYYVEDETYIIDNDFDEDAGFYNEEDTYINHDIEEYPYIDESTYRYVEDGMYDNYDVGDEQYGTEDDYETYDVEQKLTDLECGVEESVIANAEYDTEEWVNEEECDIDHSKTSADFDADTDYCTEKELHVEENEVENVIYDTEEVGITDECDTEEVETFIGYHEEGDTYDNFDNEDESYSECDEEEICSKFDTIEEETYTDDAAEEYELKEEECDVDDSYDENPVKEHEIYNSGAKQSATHTKLDTDENIIVKKDTNHHQHLILLFESLVNELMQDYNLCENAVEKAINDMNNSFRNVRSGKIRTEINFDDMNYCVGYVHRFAPCHAAMVHDAVLKVLESPPYEISGKFSISNQQLNVVCLGSGPGNDLVGFLSAFHSQCMKLKDLDITVVDKMFGWNHVFKNTIQVLQKESHGNLSRLFQEGPYINTSYIQADLENYFWCYDLQSKLESADIILLVKVLSHIPDENKLIILKNIEICMQPGALLFFIDCPIPSKECAALSSLRTVYKTNVNFFSFSHKSKHFGHRNINGCHASTHIFVKQN